MRKEMLQIASFLIGCVVLLAGRAYADSNSVVVAEATPDSALPAPAAPVQTAPDPIVNQAALPSMPTPCAKKKAVDFGGWIETGSWGNEYGDDSTVENGSPLGSSIYNEGWHVQQLWLFAEKKADNGGCGFDWGFRADAMFGTDASILQSYAGGGLIDGDWSLSGDGYGWAMPQAYAELAMNRWTFKLGKFMTPLGYEAIDAPNKLFYSHSYAYTHEPATHTGALAELAWNENVTFLGGLTTGSDGSFDNRYGDFGILGGVELQLTEKLNFRYVTAWDRVHADMERTDAYPLAWDCASSIFSFIPGFSGHEMLNTFVLEWCLTDRLTYAWQGNYGWADINVGPGDTKCYEQMAIVNYLTYQMTERLTLGGRFEWFRQNDLISLWQSRQYCYELAGVAKYQLCKNLALTGEMRYDKIFGNGPYGGAELFGANGAENDQFSYGFSILATF